MEQQTVDIEVKNEVSPRENLRIKMVAIYSGLGRSRVNEEYQYKIFEDRMPSNGDLREYLLAKADYLKDLMKKQENSLRVNKKKLKKPVLF